MKTNRPDNINEGLDYSYLDDEPLNEFWGAVLSIGGSILLPYAFDYFKGSMSGSSSKRGAAAAESMINSNAKFASSGKMPMFGRVARILGRFTKFAAPIAAIVGGATYFANTEGGKDEYQISETAEKTSINDTPAVTMMSIFGVRQNEYPANDKTMDSILKENKKYGDLVSHFVQVSHKWAWAWGYGSIKTILKDSDNAKTMDIINDTFPITHLFAAAKAAHSNNWDQAISKYLDYSMGIPKNLMRAGDALLGAFDEAPDPEELKKQAIEFRSAIGQFWNYFSGDRMMNDVQKILASTELDESTWDTASRKAQVWFDEILQKDTAAFKSMLLFTQHALETSSPFSYMINIDHQDIQASMDTLSRAGFGKQYNYGSILKLSKGVLSDLDHYYDTFPQTTKWTWQRIFTDTAFGEVQRFMISVCAILTICDKIEGKNTFTNQVDKKNVIISKTDPTKSTKVDQKSQKNGESVISRSSKTDPAKVRELQKTLDLILSIKSNKNIKVTGTFDTETELGVKEVQKMAGISQTGQVDPVTREKIKELLQKLGNI